MNKGLKILAWTAFFVLMVLAFGYVTTTLWNWLVPTLFQGPVITFWQGLGLLVLCKILFGGFGGGHHKCGSHNRHWAWKQHYYQKFANMSPEDRERFKAKMKEKWCYRDSNASESKSNTSNG